MVIEVFQRLRRSPYLATDEHSLTYFPNNTLCLRRSMLEEVGGYNEDLSTAEDVDLCSRIYLTKWRMYRCPGLRLYHRARRSVGALARQWWGYGKNIPRVFQARNPGEWEMVLLWTPVDYLRLVQKRGMPFSLCLFLNPFLFMHLLALAAWAAARCQQPVAAWTLGVGAALMAVHYFYVDFIGRSTGWGLAWVRYVANCAFFAGHLVGGLACGCLYVPQVIWERRD